MIPVCRAVIFIYLERKKMMKRRLKKKQKKPELSSWPEIRNRHSEKAVDIYIDKYNHMYFAYFP